MRLATITSVLCLAVACLAQDQALKITAVLKTKSPQLESPVIVTFTMRNMSDRALTLVMGNPARNYDFTVLDESGQQLPLTTYGKNSKDRIGYRYFPTLAPGAEISEDVRIDELIEISHPGHFTLKARRQSSPDGPGDNSRWTLSESNAFSFAVSPKRSVKK